MSSVAADVAGIGVLHSPWLSHFHLMLGTDLAILDDLMVLIGF